LALKPEKCKLLPPGGALSAKRKSDVEKYLAEAALEWKAFQVTDMAEYLGFQVGYRAGTISSWAKPLKKFKSFTAELSACGIAASLGTDTYNAKIATVTSYVEQLCPPTAEYLKLERSAIEKTMHCPHNAHPPEAPFLFDQAGMRKFVNLELRALAAQVWTALRTCTSWRVELDKLNAARREFGPMVNLASSAASAPILVDYSRWQTEAYADVLARASTLDPIVVEGIRGTKAHSIQVGTYRNFIASRLPNDLALALLPRLREQLGGTYPDDKVLEAMRGSLKLVKSIAPQAGWALVRTWCNGWVTSSRVGAGSRRVSLDAQSA
jgi:hypothetical protein